MPVFLHPALERQSLVETDGLDAEATRRLQHGVRDLLVVETPRLRRGAVGQARVAFPRADLQVGGLTPHLVQVARALVGGHEPVRDEPLGGGESIDHVPRLHRPRDILNRADLFTCKRTPGHQNGRHAVLTSLAAVLLPYGPKHDCGTHLHTVVVRAN